MKFSIKDFFSKCDQICRKLNKRFHWIKFYLNFAEVQVEVLLTIKHSINPDIKKLVINQIALFSNISW